MSNCQILLLVIATWIIFLTWRLYVAIARYERAEHELSRLRKSKFWVVDREYFAHFDELMQALYEDAKASGLID